MLNGMFAVVNKSTPRREQLAPIPPHRWEVVAHNLEHRQRPVLFDIKRDQNDTTYMCPPEKMSMRPSPIALILLVPLIVMSWFLIISQVTKKRVVNNISPIEEEKEERIEGLLLAVKEKERMERPLLIAKEKEEMTNTLKKEVDNTSLSPWVVEVCSFLHHNEARNLARSLKDQGFPAFVSRIDLKGQRWYRVRIGVY